VSWGMVMLMPANNSWSSSSSMIIPPIMRPRHLHVFGTSFLPCS
jgi:hypothetical protein